ncbi:hypothetical protein ABI_20420 [Asticcacaulis biprosthecium C19]|uniref:Uncharacterized protein n=1 Tax=Asticcacaulis biprosthecium C19 TaxID=715226 RepID=F4QM29_9CAUL|nr:hypothetical protein [Asticcacaulis biprosthecium]EGF93601.1 hypothetical protein ABI_20420 [Asticcacaulis biprosthecium C19]
MARTIDLHDEVARRDYFRMLFRTLDNGGITPRALRITLDGVVKASTHMDFDDKAQAELTGFLTRVIDMYKFGEIDILAATDDIDLLVMAAEADSPDLMQFVYVGPETFGCMTM